MTSWLIHAVKRVYGSTKTKKYGSTKTSFTVHTVSVLVCWKATARDNPKCGVISEGTYFNFGSLLRKISQITILFYFGLRS